MDYFNLITNALEKKDFHKAKEIAEKIKNEIEKYNVLGIINFQEKKMDESKKCFEKALKIDSANDDVLFNYSKLLFEMKKYFESWRYLTRISEKTWEVYDMLGDNQLHLDNPSMALKYYKKAYEVSNINELKDKYLSIKQKVFNNKNIAIFCLPGMDGFIKDIAESFSEIYNVKLVVTSNGKEIIDAYNWADIVWIEWANELAIEITNKLPKENKNILCRLHGYESLRKDLLNKINWENIDKVIFVANHVKENAIKNCDDLKYISSKVIPNGIDLTKYKYKIRKNGFNLVFAGFFNYKKNPVLAIQILKKLIQINEKYNFYWVGKIQDERMFNYINYMLKEMHIEENFHFDDWTNNIDSYLEDKNFFLSSSIHEGYGVAILEAMAKGIKPVIHNFYKAIEFYPNDLIFNTIDDAVNLILKDDYDSEKYRKFVEENASLENQINEIINVIKKLNYDSNIETSAKKIESIKIIDPIKEKFSINPNSYEDDLELSLKKYMDYINFLVPNVLISDKNLEYMIDFLKKVFDKKIHYKKTLYYAFLSDVYKKGLYMQKPEIIINKFISLYENIKLKGKIYNPIVSFINDGNLYGLNIIPNNRNNSIKIPQEIKFWTISGRHRVAIANYLGFKHIPAYIIKNQFLYNKGIKHLLPAYWKEYINIHENEYKEFINIEYVGAFDGDYHSAEPINIKKELITNFILSVKPKTLIDIGCNRGELSYPFKKQNINVIGIDISPKERLSVPEDYNFIQMNVVESELPMEADVILFLSVYHHIFYNYGKDVADKTFFKLFKKTKYLIFDSGHPEEKGIYRQAWINKLKKFFKNEKELLDHFGIPYKILGNWRTSQESYRTLVVFENKKK